MTKNIALAEVDPYFDAPDGTAGFRACDFCGQSTYDDLHKPSCRVWYELLGENGLIVCEYCLPDLLADNW